MDKGGYGYDSSYGSSSYGGSYGGYGSNYGSSYDFSYGYGRSMAAHGPIARALNCWPANFDFDTLMSHEDPTPDPPYGIEDTPRENHIFGPLHLYGSEEHSRYAKIQDPTQTEFTAGEDPGLRASLGGHYHYGHHHHDYVENSLPSEWVHYHSARHAGCLYEIPDFSYNAGTWDKIWNLWYYNGYYTAADTTDDFKHTPANSDGVVYSPNWVHFFNAHVLPSKGKGASLVPRKNSVAEPAADAVNYYTDDSASIQLVMANPQYEGLGWLNFVATYGVHDVPVGSAYQEFADSTHVTLTGDISATYDSYTPINNADVTQQTQGTTGNYYFDAWMGTWQIRLDTANTRRNCRPTAEARHSPHLTWQFRLSHTMNLEKTSDSTYEFFFKTRAITNARCTISTKSTTSPSPSLITFPTHWYMTDARATIHAEHHMMETWFRHLKSS